MIKIMINDPNSPNIVRFGSAPNQYQTSGQQVAPDMPVANPVTLGAKPPTPVTPSMANMPSSLFQSQGVTPVAPLTPPLPNLSTQGKPPVPPSIQTQSLTIKKEEIVNIKALLATLVHLNDMTPQEKEKQPRPFVSEDAFILTRAFMKGCQEAGLNSDQTQKLLDELLGTETPNQPSGQLNPLLKIALCIQKKLSLS